MAGMSEAAWEQLVTDELAELAWKPKDGKQIAPGSGEPESWSELIIPRRLRNAIAAVNPALPVSAVEDAVAIVLTATSRDARAENLRTHEFLTQGIRSVTYTEIHKHVRRPAQNKVIQKRAKDPDDELELIIVQSMLLTGFDSPPAEHHVCRQADARRGAHAGPVPSEPDLPE